MIRGTIFSPIAEQQLFAIVQWWSANRNREQALEWYDHVLLETFEIAKEPMRFQKAPESGLFNVELREKYVGLRGSRTHRIVYSIEPEVIFIHAIQHLAQDRLTTKGLLGES